MLLGLLIQNLAGIIDFKGGSRNNKLTRQRRRTINESCYSNYSTYATQPPAKLIKITQKAST